LISQHLSALRDVLKKGPQYVTGEDLQAIAFMTAEALSLDIRQTVELIEGDG